MTVGQNGFYYSLVENWGEKSLGSQINFVSGVAIDAQDNVYTFARDTTPVMVFTPEGELIARWGEGQFTRAHGIAIGTDGNVYCADDKDHTIRSFTQRGEPVRTWGTKGKPVENGYDGATPTSVRFGGGPFNRPTNVAFAPDGTMFVSDGYGNARVHKFGSDGQYLKSWGEPGNGPGEFLIVHCVAVDPRGRVVVADRENNRLQFFTQEGEFLEQWPLSSRPEEIDFDKEGNLYVAEGFGLISIFDLDGKLLASWGKEQPDDGKAAEFVPKAHTMAVDSKGSVYVASQNFQKNGFVKKFERVN
ncbi:DNA-binding beta-propeller fold protein YncE [Aminobacter niigataensis]|uniref:DNA-binding beta-propeller fold protein YncE n=1 Tax=Aminobacter niigataensis TaxID=83265 RepID=A0ABR6L198_9HYPH|nr:peptidyl-alpha-hydroxyglycine alpha-amidating lyase family protein [Aminobacter niigataensis]MBB4650582.1 DNA-binding beta-propeller fold protein YncE [Aminobacter niigataensis]